MAKCDVLLKSLENGEFDQLLKDQYGEEMLDYHKQRYENLLKFFGMIYGRTRTCGVYSVPYSVLLAGDGADLAIPTDIDFVAVAETNQTNVTRARALNYLGEDLVDLFQRGPYTLEAEHTVAAIRGVQQAYRHFGHKKEGGLFIFANDMYMDSFTLPGQGIDESSHLAIAVAYLINQLSFDGQLTEKQIAEIVQYAMANYVNMDSSITDIYASLRGKAITGNFENPEAEVIGEVDVDMLGRKMFLVDIDQTDINIHDHEIDPRLDAFLTKLGKPVDEISEKEFYQLLAEMADVDKEAALFLMDFYTQENFGEIYAANTVDGIGSPSLEKTVDDEKESLAGAAKWHLKVEHPFWMTLCCVSEEAQPEFEKAMEKLFGEGCMIAVNGAKSGATKLL